MLHRATEKIYEKYEKTAKLNKKLQKQKSPVNYFQSNITIGIFILFISTTLLSDFFDNILKLQIY